MNMTIEEKARAYDEAIERARLYSRGHSVDVNPQSAMEYVFPELKENMHIQGELIGGLMWQRDHLDHIGPHDDNLILPGFTMSVGKLIKWLEKQKHIEWDGADEAHISSIITHLEQWIDQHPGTIGADIQRENVAWLKSL